MFALFACFDVRNLLIFLRVFCLCRMSKPLPKEGTKEYYEMLADEPSDFIKKPEEIDEEEDDNESGNFIKDTCKDKEKDVVDDEDDDETGVSSTKTALAAENKKLKALFEAANAALKTAPSPTGRAKYDHETTKKNLVKRTAPVRALMETHKEDYEAVYFMWSLCDYWKSLILLDRAQNNEHIAFIKYFRKYRPLYGLPVFEAATPSPKGSKTSSRAVSVAPVDESIEEDDDEGAGAA
jgi:hypothetical protein